MSVQFSGVARINYFMDDGNPIDTGLKRFAQRQTVNQLRDQGYDHFTLFESSGDDYVAYNTQKQDYPGKLAESHGTELMFELQQCQDLLPKDFSKTDTQNVSELNVAIDAIKSAYARLADQNKNTVNVFISNLQPSETIDEIPVSPPVYHVKVDQLNLSE